MDGPSIASCRTELRMHPRATAEESEEEVISRLLELNWNWGLPKPLHGQAGSQPTGGSSQLCLRLIWLASG
jgi:hypothetical protein